MALCHKKESDFVLLHKSNLKFDAKLCRMHERDAHRRRKGESKVDVHDCFQIELKNEHRQQHNWEIALSGSSIQLNSLLFFIFYF